MTVRNLEAGVAILIAAVVAVFLVFAAYAHLVHAIDRLAPQGERKAHRLSPLAESATALAGTTT